MSGLLRSFGSSETVSDDFPLKDMDQKLMQYQ